VDQPTIVSLEYGHEFAVLDRIPTYRHLHASNADVRTLQFKDEAGHALHRLVAGEPQGWDLESCVTKNLSWWPKRPQAPQPQQDPYPLGGGVGMDAILNFLLLAVPRVPFP
jgi:hypothetical protein